MKRSVLGKMLGLALAAAVAITSSVPSFAAEEIAVADLEEAVIEEVQEDFSEEDFQEEEAEAEEDFAEEDLYEEAAPAEEVFEEEVPAEEVFEEEIIEEAEEDAEEEAVLTENDEVQPVEDGEEPVKEPEAPENDYEWEHKSYTFVLHNKIGKKDVKKTVKVTKADKDKNFGDVFKRTGYTFWGWSWKVDDRYDFFTPDVTVGYMIYSLPLDGKTKIDLYAEWSEYLYTVVFYDAEGNKLEKQPFGFEQSLLYGDTVDLLAAAEDISQNMEEDINIVGFSRTKGGKKDFELKRCSGLATSDGEQVDLYPVLGDGEYSIYYALNTDEVLSKNITSYKPGKKVVLPTVKATGFNFLGWFPCNKDGEYIESGLEDVFEYKKVKAADGWEGEVIVAIKSTAKQTVRLYPFLDPVVYKLYLDPNGKGVKDGDKEIKKKQYLGKFNYQGDMIYEEGTYLPNNLEKRGSIFVGFSLNPKAKTAEECVSIDDNGLYGLTTKKSATLYCIWEKIPYPVMYLNEAVVFDPTSAKELMDCDYTAAFLDDSQPADGFAYEDASFYGTAKKVRAGKAIAGCTFVGWRAVEASEAKYETNKSGFVTKVKADNEAELVLIGVYKENGVKLKFDTCGGTIVDPKTGKEVKGKISPLGDELAKPYTNAEGLQKAFSDCIAVYKDGYGLKGLYFDKKGKKPVTIEAFRALCKKQNATVTIYAVWEAK